MRCILLLVVSACSSPPAWHTLPDASSDDAPTLDASHHDASTEAATPDSGSVDATSLFDAGDPFFDCASTQCDETTQFCHVYLESSDAGWCEGYPTSCKTTPSCACITIMQGCTCNAIGLEITVRCP